MPASASEALPGAVAGVARGTAHGLPAAGDHAACYDALAARDARLDGLLYACVRSTGIYCRPVCGARLPRAANVEFRTSAAAAEQAGYRPCLLCCPERAPGPGFLATPSADAASRNTSRALFARQLLRETALSERDVARAAGFGGVAALRRAVTASSGEDPAALRQRRRRRTVAGQITLRLDYRPPFDWAALLEFHRARAIPGVEAVRGRRYLRVLDCGGQPVLLTLAAGAGNTLELTLRDAPATALDGIVTRVREAFDLDAHPALVAAAFARDRDLAPLVRARPGLRVAGSVDRFEQAVRAILGQQISVTAARRLAARLCQRWGTPVAFADAPELAFSFPSPAVLAQADVAALGMPGARGRAVSALARAVLDDPALLARGVSLDASLARLQALPGIGAWTAQYIALRALREPDAFPAGDIGLQRALADRRGQRPSARELARRAQAWSPLGAYAAQYLWTHDANAP